MADVVTTQTIADTQGIKYVVKMTNLSDGTGENLVTKVDASELTFMTEDGNRKISKIWYSINTSNNKSGVELLWGGTTNSTAVFLSEHYEGQLCLRCNHRFHPRPKSSKCQTSPSVIEPLLASQLALSCVSF